MPLTKNEAYEVLLTSSCLPGRVPYLHRASNQARAPLHHSLHGVGHLRAHKVRECTKACSVWHKTTTGVQGCRMQKQDLPAQRQLTLVSGRVGVCCGLVGLFYSPVCQIEAQSAKGPLLSTSSTAQQRYAGLAALQIHVGPGMRSSGLGRHTHTHPTHKHVCHKDHKGHWHAPWLKGLEAQGSGVLTPGPRQPHQAASFRHKQAPSWGWLRRQSAPLGAYGALTTTHPSLPMLPSFWTPSALFYPP